MPNYNFFLFIAIILLMISCSNKPEQVSVIKEKNLYSQMSEAYKEGLKALEDWDAIFAAKKFNEAEILYPQSEFAPKASIMAAYSYYSQDYYEDAIAELQRFIRVYPLHYDLNYVEYLLALSFYEQIVDEKKDTRSILESKKAFQNIMQKYPNTDYAIDASFKIDLINDILASKEIYIARYYFDKKKYIAAINRFREVIEKYDTTVYVEEALYRMVEIHYILGLENEAKKYASLLGYNYQSSKWYEKSYSFFNKMYAEQALENSEKDKKSNFILRKFKSLFKWDGKKRN